MPITVVKDALFRVFNEKDLTTTFEVVTLAAGNDVGIGIAAVSHESRMNRQRNGKTYAFVVCGKCGDFEEFVDRKLFLKGKPGVSE